MVFIGTLQAIAVTFVAEHDPSVWRIGWDMSLLASAYAVRILKKQLTLLQYFNFDSPSMSKVLHCQQITIIHVYA